MRENHQKSGTQRNNHLRSHTRKHYIQDILDNFGIRPTKAVPMRNSASTRVKLSAVTQCKNCFQFGHVRAHYGRKPTRPSTSNAVTDTPVCTHGGQVSYGARQAKCP
ncbi:hypothetical protein EVAR_5462_1 [Eumeta japonica]|uniref:Uncharacterized protein n=1 Tax=Eumeta variegata TaxID=151549 RepID=A0A4C1T8X6_EUMVA|nr:hypothetical protein EVAR_5462_1 [Eumeta japonica]